MSDDKVPWVHRPPAGGEYYVFRDPIHNLIAIQDDEEGRFIRAILDTKELQRLRRIAQNGVAAYVYPGLEATRFPHSLGSYYIAKKIITSLQERQPSEREGFPRPLHITPRDCVAFPLAALLHDIGHGPLSHAWEEIFHTHPQFQSHEALGHAIVESTATEIGDLLHKVSTGDEAYKRLFPNLLGIKEDLLDFLKGRHRLSYLQPLLAGNLDVDRMDFMARDTQNAGVTYGVHELEWLIRSLRFAQLPAHLSDGRSDAEWVIAIDGRKGLAALNQFLRARENMYRLVYHHKTSRGAQMLLGSIMKRAMELTKESQSEKAPFCSHSFARWMRNEEFSLNDYLRLDDTDVWSHVKLWADSKDSVLGPLCRQMLSRSFFKVLQISEETYRILRQIDEPSMGHHLSNIIQLRGNFDSALASHFYAFREDSLLLVGREPRDFSSKVWLMRAGVLGHIYTSLHDYWRAELGREDQGELRVISYSLGIHRRFLGDILNLVDHLESRFAGQIGPSLLYGAGPRPPDPYRVVTSLGAPGEWKEVYLGLCSRVGVRKDTLYALKCYRDNRTHEIVSAKRRDIYSQRLVRAQSPHLSETFEIGEEDGRHWLGETLWTSSLDRFVREYGPFRDLREIARMATHLYRGLAALHEYDLRHTDLKPDNCGFVQEGRLNRRYLIGDFGCVDPDPSLVPSDPLMLGTQRTRSSGSLAYATQYRPAIGCVGPWRHHLFSLPATLPVHGLRRAAWQYQRTAGACRFDTRPSRRAVSSV